VPRSRGQGLGTKLGGHIGFWVGNIVVESGRSVKELDWRSVYLQQETAKCLVVEDKGWTPNLGATLVFGLGVSL